MENKSNKQNEGFGADDGARKISTAYRAELLKQQIVALSKMIGWRKENIRTLSKSKAKEELGQNGPQMTMAR